MSALTSLSLTLALAACVTLGGTAAEAGAWPRGEGKSFLTVTLQSQITGQNTGKYTTLFYEYGLNPRLTVGIDAGRNVATRENSGVLFLRFPIFDASGANKFAFEPGIGWAESNGKISATFRPGLSWGRGYQAGWGQGWMGIESSYALRDDGTGLGKIDGTFGINHPNGALSILQVQYANPSDGDSSVALAPSYVVKVSDIVSLELGGRFSLDNDASFLKVGVWLSF